MLYLDTETTGLVSDDTIVEVAIVDDNGSVILNTLCNPQFIIRTDAVNTHGITDIKLVDAPSSQEVIQQVLDICQDQDVCIYNAEFDCRMIPGLENAARSINCCMKRFSEHYGEWSDYFGGYRWKSLLFAAQRTGYKWPTGSHRALPDALACRHIWQALPQLEAKERAKRLEELQRREELEIEQWIKISYSDYTRPTDAQISARYEFMKKSKEFYVSRQEDAIHVFTIKQRERARLAKEKISASKAAKQAERIEATLNKIYAPYFSCRDWPRNLCMHSDQIMKKYKFDPMLIEPPIEPVAYAEINAYCHIVGELWLISDVIARNEALTDEERKLSRARRRKIRAGHDLGSSQQGPGSANNDENALKVPVVVDIRPLP